MILRIKLQRSEIIPWGFRLTGGAEFEAPLTVTKVIIRAFRMDSDGSLFAVIYSLFNQKQNATKFTRNCPVCFIVQKCDRRQFIEMKV